MQDENPNTVFWSSAEVLAGYRERASLLKPTPRAERMFFYKLPHRSRTTFSANTYGRRWKRAVLTLRHRSPSAADSTTSASASVSITQASPSCHRTSDYQSFRLFFTCRQICPTRALLNLSRKPRIASGALLEITRGRASYLHQLRADERDLRPPARRVGFPMLKQGDAPKSALLEEFRITPHAVLFGTSSFWQGVDVQGEQLSCVIIDRLAFRRAERPGSSRKSESNRRQRRQRLLRLSSPKRSYHAEARLRKDRYARYTIEACWPCSTTVFWKKQYGKVFVESLAELQQNNRPAESRGSSSSNVLGRLIVPRRIRIRACLQATERFAH